MKNYVILIILLLFTIKMHSQEINLLKHNIGVDFGIVKYSMTDKSLNYYKYNSTSFSPINVHYYFLGEKNIHFLNLNFISTKLSTKQATDSYVYNYINMTDSKLKYEYFHKLSSIKGKLNLYFGCSLDLIGTIFEQNYQSNYWQDVQQYSYDISGNILVNALLRYQILNGSFMFKTGYALINYTSRPDDYYIKYGNQVDDLEWKWYSINNYQKIPISLMFHFDVSNRLSIRFEYLSEFRKYITENEFYYLKQSWLTGMSFKF